MPVGRIPLVVKPGRRDRQAAAAADFRPKGKPFSAGVKWPSDVVALPDGRFFVVGDRAKTAAIVDRQGRAEKVVLEGVKGPSSEFEGAAYDPVNKRLFVAREESGELLRYDWDPSKQRAPKLTHVFKSRGFQDGNKGVEGLAWLPGWASPTGTPQLVVVKEGHPRKLGLLDAAGGDKPREVELDERLKDVCKDFSGVAVDPLTGNLFICSDESAVVAEVEFVRKGDSVKAMLVKALPLRDRDDRKIEKVEGLTFDAKGNLFIALERDHELMEFERK